jgi:hypothetical protein
MDPTVPVGKDTPPTGLRVGPVDSASIFDDDDEGGSGSSGSKGGSGGGSRGYAVKVEDGRTDAYYEDQSWLKRMIGAVFLGGSATHHFTAAAAIPIDYSRFDKTRPVICAESELAALDTVFKMPYNIYKLHDDLKSGQRKVKWWKYVSTLVVFHFLN